MRKAWHFSCKMLDPRGEKPNDILEKFYKLFPNVDIIDIVFCGNIEPIPNSPRETLSNFFILYEEDSNKIEK